MCFTGCDSNSGVAYLFLDGEYIGKSKNTIVGRGKLEISLLDTLAALDYEITQNDNIVNISKGEDEYVLSFDEETLNDGVGDKNLLDQKEKMGEFETNYYKFIKNDVLLNICTLEYLLDDMHTPIYLVCYPKLYNKICNIKIVRRLCGDEREKYNIVIEGKKYKYEDLYFLDDLGVGIEGAYNVMIPMSRTLNDMGFTVVRKNQDEFYAFKGLIPYTISLPEKRLEIFGIGIEQYFLAGVLLDEYHMVATENELYYSDVFFKATLKMIGIDCAVLREYKGGPVYIVYL